MLERPARYNDPEGEIDQNRNRVRVAVKVLDLISSAHPPGARHPFGGRIQTFPLLLRSTCVLESIGTHTRHR